MAADFEYPKLNRQQKLAVFLIVIGPEAATRALPNNNAVTPELLNELIRHKPANVGVALRDWVAAGASPASKN
jgi:flagellar M-ring protein FliF